MPSETFQLLGYVWDIDCAKAAAAGQETISVPLPTQLMGMVRIDKDYAREHPRPDEPIILAPLGDERGWLAVPIDGWHRIAYWAKQGAERIEAVYLSPQEAYGCLIAGQDAYCRAAERADPEIKLRKPRPPRRNPSKHGGGRDRDREGRLPAEARTLLDEWLSLSPARPRWNIVYEALESGEPEVYAEIREAIENLRHQASQKERWAEEEAELERWESQADEVETHLSPAAMERRYRGRNVWLYHGTSSALLPRILAKGLRPDTEFRIEDEGVRGAVFLTADPGYRGGKGDALFYARRAVAHHGGEPVVLRLVVPWDELDFDPDDEDLPSGRYQFVFYGTIPPAWIRQVDDERVVSG